jgi:hypothetical protein
VTHSTLPCNHSLFQWSSEGAWSGAPEGIQNPHIFVFERKKWLTPTDEQIAEYRRAREIVERLGGTMNRREWEIAGKSEVFSASEVQEMLEAVTRDNPKASVIQYWNGAGCYTLSVGVEIAS